MTEKGHINLTSSDFLPHVFKCFTNIQADNLFTDVTLVSDDNIHYQAHKLILSAGSEYFRNILSDKTHPHPMLCLDGVTSADLERVIKYLYVGQVSVPHSSLQKFLKVSQKLKCYGLHEKELQEYKCQEVMDTQTEQEEDEEHQQLEDEEINPEMFLEKNTVKDSLDEEEYRQLDVRNAQYEIELEEEEKERQRPEVEKTKSEIYLDTNATEKDPLPETSEINVSKDIEGEKKIGRPKKNNSMAPKFCRINGKTFSHDQLEDILKEKYYRKDERKDGVFFSCLHCDYETKTRQHVVDHSQKHINLEVDCDRCGKIYSGYAALRGHQRTCLGVGSPKFCRIEGKTLSYKELEDVLKEQYYRRGKRNDGVFYSCLHCDYESKSKQNVFEHSQKHINIEVDCNKCGKIINGFKGLKKHKRYCSEVGLPKFCRIEGKTFSYKELEKIQSELFSGKGSDGSFSCKHCDFKTIRRDHMGDHAQTHLQDLEVDCDDCGKTFRSSAELRYHKKRSCP